MRNLYRLAEVLEMLSLSRTQAYREMKEGRLAFIQSGNRRLFEPEAVEAFVASLKETDAVDRLLHRVDSAGRIDVAELCGGVTLADLAELKRIVAERREVA